MTRPPKYDKSMTERILVRLTPEQKKVIELRCKEVGKKPAEFMRHVTTKAARLGWGY